MFKAFGSHTHWDVSIRLMFWNFSQGARNILLDRGGQLKISGFGLIRLSKISQENMKIANHKAHIDLSSKEECFIHILEEVIYFGKLYDQWNITFLFADYYIAPEVYKDEIIDRRVDAHSFGIILYEVHFLVLLGFFSFVSLILYVSVTLYGRVVR